MQNAVNTTVSKYGKLDIMFSNAGISGGLETRIVHSDNATFKRVLVVNVYGAVLAGKHAARVMIPAKRGCIIFTSSLVSVVSGLAVHAYTASKHAVVGLSNNLCVELGQYGIRVNCIFPFVVATGMLDLGTVGGRAVRYVTRITEEKKMTARKNVTRTKPRNQLIRKAESRERHDLLKTDSPSPWCSEKSLRRLFPRIQWWTSSTSTPRHCSGELKLCPRLSLKHHTLDELKTKRKNYIS